MAVGVRPATEFLEDSGFSLERDGSLSVDEYLRVPGRDSVYAIGETTSFLTEPTLHLLFVQAISQLTSKRSTAATAVSNTGTLPRITDEQSVELSQDSSRESRSGCSLSSRFQFSGVPVSVQCSRQYW